MNHSTAFTSGQPVKYPGVEEPAIGSHPLVSPLLPPPESAKTDYSVGQGLERGEIAIRRSRTIGIIVAATFLQAVAVAFAEDGAPPPNPYVHRMGAQETLRAVAERYYGNHYYSMVIELVNDIPHPYAVEPGMAIRVPKLDAILAEEGVSTVMPYEIHTMLAARASYMEVEEQLRSIGTSTGSGYITVPEDVQETLRAAANDMWDVAMALRVVKPQVKIIPNRAIGQLKAVSFQLNRISYGALDSFGNDLDAVHQRIAWAICNAIVWARNGYQYK